MAAKALSTGTAVARGLLHHWLTTHTIEVDIPDVVLKMLYKFINEVLGLLKGVSVPIPCHTLEYLIVFSVYLSKEKAL